MSISLGTQKSAKTPPQLWARWSDPFDVKHWHNLKKNYETISCIKHFFFLASIFNYFITVRTKIMPNFWRTDIHWQNFLIFFSSIMLILGQQFCFLRLILICTVIKNLCNMIWVKYFGRFNHATLYSNVLQIWPNHK